MTTVLAFLDTSTLGLFDFDCTLLGAAFLILIGEFIYGKIALASKASVSRNQTLVRVLMATPYSKSFSALRTGWDDMSTFVSSKLRYGFKAVVHYSLITGQATKLLLDQKCDSKLFVSAVMDLELK